MLVLSPSSETLWESNNPIRTGVISHRVFDVLYNTYTLSYTDIPERSIQTPEGEVFPLSEKLYERLCLLLGKEHNTLECAQTAFILNGEKSFQEWEDYPCHIEWDTVRWFWRMNNDAVFKTMDLKQGDVITLFWQEEKKKTHAMVYMGVRNGAHYCFNKIGRTWYTITPLDKTINAYVSYKAIRWDSRYDDYLRFAERIQSWNYELDRNYMIRVTEAK